LPLYTGLNPSHGEYPTYYTFVNGPYLMISCEGPTCHRNVYLKVVLFTKDEKENHDKKSEHQF